MALCLIQCKLICMHSCEFDLHGKHTSLSYHIFLLSGKTWAMDVKLAGQEKHDELSQSLLTLHMYAFQ